MKRIQIAEAAFEKVNSAESFRKTGYSVIDLLAEELDKSNQTVMEPALHWETPERQLEYWENDFYAEKIEDPVPLFREIIKRSINMTRRGNLGHQISAPHPVSILTSALMAYLNNGMGVYEVGMAGNVMEKIVVRDLSRRFGLPEDASGFVTSGGSLGNLTALLSAKEKFLKENPDTRHEQLAILVSEEAHYSIERAVAVMGLPKENLIKLPIDADFRMRTDLLEEYRQKAESTGRRIFCVVGCACSTSTGAFDNLKSIAAFAKPFDVWFHVDAAHGGPVIFSTRYKQLLKGIEDADSIVMDFHKMMGVPSLSTAVFYRHVGYAQLAFSQHAKYLWQNQQSEEWYNSGKRTFECTKPMTILHIYTILRMYGSEIYEQQIDFLYGLAELFSETMMTRPEFEVLSKPQSNIVCFRYIGKGTDLNGLNREIQKKIVRDGTFYVVGTMAYDQYYLRISLMNTRTTSLDLMKLADSIVFIAGQIEEDRNRTSV